MDQLIAAAPYGVYYFVFDLLLGLDWIFITQLSNCGIIVLHLSPATAIFIILLSIHPYVFRVKIIIDLQYFPPNDTHHIHNGCLVKDDIQ